MYIVGVGSIGMMPIVSSPAGSHGEYMNFRLFPSSTTTSETCSGRLLFLCIFLNQSWLTGIFIAPNHNMKTHFLKNNFELYVLF